MISHAFHTWERRLAAVDTNRVVRPFEWGLDWLGLSGSHDTPLARVLSLADTYVALCSARFQRMQYNRVQVEQYIESTAGDLFDPRVVRVLLEDLPAAVMFEQPAA